MNKNVFKQLPSLDSLPKHIGIIMDGNGRWAKKRGLPRYAGHSAGAQTFKSITRYCNEIGIKYLTVYAFSTENWARSDEEISGIMKLLEDYLDNSSEQIDENVKVRFIGDLLPLSQNIKTKIKKAEEKSSNATGLNLNVAINYGGRLEIVNAIKNISKDISENKINIENIDEKMVNRYLYTCSQPDVDLIIRPSGEYRTSNFMIWQSVYAEYVFMDVLWPDFKKRHLTKALEEYSIRHRRFGGV